MNILVVSHGDFAKGLCSTLNMFFNGADVGYICLKSEGVEHFARNIQSYFEETVGDILILCDLQGGTPFNQAVNISMKLGIQDRTKIIAGVNLPMLLDVYALRKTLDLKSAKSVCENSGKNGITSFEQISAVQEDDF